ncbi:GNAT family N-acetyltransferase [uncultured Pseudoteredinibacter sp.]|uniref:GNAT family N-acetyltransferase n=1 Tax=uncultured Pseudoteredinibacter sp. TaxID=1641701 RepID=UPI00261EE110|nr:GNAT family N-acetyltransferase [uncultured Pseudoteredinibacter sp.]
MNIMIELPNLPMATERLTIRQATLDDARFFLELMTSKGWLENIGDRGIYQLSDAQAHIQNNVHQSYLENGFGMYVVCDCNNKAIGSVGFIDRPTLEHVDIGYAFLADAGGKGYAIEACRAIYQFGVEQLKIKPIVAITSPHNVRSGNILLKLGFQRSDDICLSDSGETVHYYIDPQHPLFKR